MRGGSGSFGAINACADAAVKTPRSTQRRGVTSRSTSPPLVPDAHSPGHIAQSGRRMELPRCLIRPPFEACPELFGPFVFEPQTQLEAVVEPVLLQVRRHDQRRARVGLHRFGVQPPEPGLDVQP